MLASLTTKLIAALVFIILVAGLYFAFASQEREIATLKVTAAMQTATIKSITDDAAATKLNQEKMFSTLNDIRTETTKAMEAVTVPRALLQDKSSAKLTSWLNAELAKQNAAIETLTAAR